MKYLPLILLFIIPALSNAQVTTSLQDGGYFYVVVEGDTVSQHVRVDKAIESASNYTDWEIVQDFRLAGRSFFYDEDIIIEEVTDTVYVNLPPHDNSFLHSVDWTHEVDRETGFERIVFTIESDNVDTLITEVRCGNEWLKKRVYPGEEGAGPPANTFRYGIKWDCDSDLIYQFRAHKGVWEQAITERFPAFVFELTDEEQAWLDSLSEPTPEGDWVPTWGTLTYEINDDLVITLPERSIARLKWDAVEQHTDIRYEIIETLHESHSTGAHISARASDEPRQYSVETYLHSDGLGVSIFNGGAWSNPISMPFEWEYGDTVQYVVEVVGDTIRMKAWQFGESAPDEWFEYSSDVIGAIPAGHFSIGSTGAGKYIINHIEVEIL